MSQLFCDRGEQANVFVDGRLVGKYTGKVSYEIQNVPQNSFQWWWIVDYSVPGYGAWLLKQLDENGKTVNIQVECPDEHRAIVYKSVPSFTYHPPLDNFSDDGYYLIGAGLSYSYKLSPGHDYFQSLPERMLRYTHKPYRLVIYDNQQ